jgi:hypothetical protein
MPNETPKRVVRVHSYTRSDGTRVRAHGRTMAAWKQAGLAWAGTTASGLTAAALVLELGFTLISVVALLLTVLLGILSAKLTAKATRPQRTMRAKAQTRPAARRTTTTTRRTRR